MNYFSFPQKSGSRRIYNVPEPSEPIKRRRETARSVFMREYRASSRALRQLPLGSPELINEANRAFDQLSFDERQLYERKAKTENKKFDSKFGDKFRRDCEGVTLESRNEAAQAAERFKQWTEDLLDKMLSAAEPHWLLDREFLIGDLFDFVSPDPGESRPNWPAEFGFVRFSLRSGVTDRLHHIVSLSADQLPPHLLFDCRDLAEQTHGIRLGHQLGGSVLDFSRQLRQLCQDSEGRPMPLFVPSASLERMQHGLLYVYNSSADIGTCPLVQEPSKPFKTRVLCLESLMRHLMACPALPEVQRLAMTDQQMTGILEKPRFTGYSECCQFHTSEDNADYCALTKAHCYAWSIFELMHTRLGFELTTAHRPLDEQLLALPKPVRLEQRPQWLRQADRPPARAQRSSPEGWTDPGRQTFGRGRGRGRGASSVAPVELQPQPPRQSTANHHSPAAAIQPAPTAFEDAAPNDEALNRRTPGFGRGRGRGLRYLEPHHDDAAGSFEAAAAASNGYFSSMSDQSLATFDVAAEALAAAFEDAAISQDQDNSPPSRFHAAAFEDAATPSVVSGPPPGLSPVADTTSVSGRGRGRGRGRSGRCGTAPIIVD